MATFVQGTLARKLKNKTALWKRVLYQSLIDEIESLIEKKKVVNFVNVGQFYWKEIDTNKDYIKAKKIYKKNL